MMSKFFNSIRHDLNRLPILDPTNSNYNFLSYLECCQSLNVIPSITKFVKYNEYWKDNFNEEENNKN